MCVFVCERERVKADGNMLHLLVRYCVCVQEAVRIDMRSVCLNALSRTRRRVPGASFLTV